VDLDNNEAPVRLKADPSLPHVSLAFKLEDGQYGQLTYIRIYQGSVRKGMELFNTRSNRRIKVGRLIRMHASSLDFTRLSALLSISFGKDAASRLPLAKVTSPGKSGSGVFGDPFQLNIKFQ